MLLSKFLRSSRALSLLYGSLILLVVAPKLYADDLRWNVGVASANPMATEAGLHILKQGGNAIDAAIAAQMVLTVVEPQSSGIGGGCFILYSDNQKQTVIALDGREEAPRSAWPEMYLDDAGEPIPFFPDRITGGRAVGVPGTVRATHKAWRLYGSGRIEWAALFETAITTASEGFAVSAGLARAIEGQSQRLLLFPESRTTFFSEAGEPLKTGSLLIQSNLANTLKLIAQQGPQVYYEGGIARDIVAAVNQSAVNPGQMVLDDLENYRAPLREPIQSKYRGWTLYGMPPPSSGGTTVAEALNVLELLPTTGLKRDSDEFIRLFSEAQRVAFEDRNQSLGDADFTEVPIARLLSAEWAESRRGAILRATKVIEGDDDNQNLSTSHISVIDAEGNMVSMTTTIEHIFGSGIVVPNRGFVLNNELTDFSARPNLLDVPHPNRPEGRRQLRRTSLDGSDSMGGKRPLSSMSPTLIFKDGVPFAALGSPGGTQIIGIVLNAIVNLIDFGMEPQAALSVGRVIQRARGLEIERLLFKDGDASEVSLTPTWREPFGNAQIVALWPFKSGEIKGASDPRGEGMMRGLVLPESAKP